MVEGSIRLTTRKATEVPPMVRLSLRYYMQPIPTRGSINVSCEEVFEEVSKNGEDDAQQHIRRRLGGRSRSRSGAEQFVTEAIQIASEAGMKIQRWKTNDPILQKKMDEEKSVRVEATSAAAGNVTETAGPAAGLAESTETSSVHSLYDKSEKVMGVVFKLKEDVFSFETGELQEFSESLRHRSSLRTVLRISERAYDPFGFISPVTILPCMFMEKIWKQKLNWDEKLPEEMKREFWAYVNELKYLREISIFREGKFDSDRLNGRRSSSSG